MAKIALNNCGRALPLGRVNVPDPHSRDAFPLEPIKNDANATDDQTRVEQGFIGAHADIGGGFENNDLSKVALAWMLQQAESAGVKMKQTSPTITVQDDCLDIFLLFTAGSVVYCSRDFYWMVFQKNGIFWMADSYRFCNKLDSGFNYGRAWGGNCPTSDGITFL
ncbi:hypothetical protein EGT07_00365 [Herbaspirillum sp. HC18]|nr:hypothetical protein EGT07_00365 [Herbaspirillum sp. HC18]